MENFRKLRVWRKAHELVILIFKGTESLLRKKRELAWQIRKSSSSISFNIAEGCGRKTKKDQAHFLQIAFGSASEAECQLLLLRDLSLISFEESKVLITEVIVIKKMLSKLISYKRNS